MTDQHRADHLSCYGNTVLTTPHMDRIAADGLRFERFYVANPVCMPNRATLMTGRMPSNHGVRHTGIPWHPRSNTFVHVLRQAGYRTALVGKRHLQNMGIRPAVLRKASPAWPVRETLARYLREPMLQDESVRTDIAFLARWRDEGEVEIPRPYYGFDYVRLTIGHGDFVRGHYQTWLAQRHPNSDGLHGEQQSLPPGRRYTSRRPGARACQKNSILRPISPSTPCNTSHSTPLQASIGNTLAQCLLSDIHCTTLGIIIR
jgi:arylsulfatase A-like enzyme